MIETAADPILSGRALRRFARLCEALEAPRPPTIVRADLHFFAGAYLGALVFFLAWLA